MTANAYILGTSRSRLSCQHFRLRINISMLISNAVSVLKSEPLKPELSFGIGYSYSFTRLTYCRIQTR
jgi:hypothetical protein